MPAMDLEDEDVARERARVEEDDDCSDELRLMQLTKVGIHICILYIYIYIINWLFHDCYSGVPRMPENSRQ